MKKLVILLIVLSLSLSFSAAAAPQSGGTLTVGLDDDPPMLDPHMSTTRVDRQVFMSLYDSLVMLDPELNVKPGLAEDWEISEDGTRYTFYLRDDVVFHDGTEFTAEAVKFNFERMLDPELGSPRKSDLDLIEEIEVVDKYTISLELSRAYVPFLSTLTDRAGMMISPAALEEYGENFSSHPVGTGPFKFVEREMQDRIVLEKNENYWQEGLPYLDEVVYKPFTDGNVRLVNMTSGELDLIDEVPPKDMEKLSEDNSVKVSTVSGVGFQGIWINKAVEPFSSDALTQALNYSINRDAIVNVVFGETAYPGHSPFPPGTSVHDESREVVQADTEKAKELLKEGGKADGYEFNMLVSPEPTAKQTAQLIQSMASQVGIKVNIELLEFGTLIDRLMATNYQAILVGWSGRVDPDGNTYRFFHSEGSMNQSNYSNPEVDKLLDAARKENDPAKRKELYGQVVEYLDEELPYIFVYHPKELKAHKNRVNGFTPYPDGLMRLHEVWVD
ncbi:MAG: ABC transporter substrate-binding protein [Bacillota bacterium]